MSTFLAVNDELLISQINQAKARVIYIAPGISKAVASCFCLVLSKLHQLNVTVILDPSDEVCRIGYGDFDGLKELHDYSKSSHFALRSQIGIRTGILIVDDQVLVWTPTPLSIEEHPQTNKMANGVMLGSNPGEQIALAIAAEGTDTTVADAEIAIEAVTDGDVAATQIELEKNPPVPVDLARATKVFNSKFQFIELEMKNVKLSKRQFKVPTQLLNADADVDLQSMLDTKLKALDDIRFVEIEVPEYGDDGSVSYDVDKKHKLCLVSEATLERRRKTLEKNYLYHLAGYGSIIEKEKVKAFELIIKAYKVQLESYSLGIKDHITDEGDKLVGQVISLIEKRNKPSIKPIKLNLDLIKKEFMKAIDQIKDDQPIIRHVLKDVTYQQTQDAEFQKLLIKNVPYQVMKRVGLESWKTVQDAVLARGE